MPIVVNTNSAATTVSFNLGRSNEALRKSLGRLSSGKRITSPADDAGGLAVALKLASKTNRTHDRTGEPTYQHSADLARIVPNSS